MAVPARDLWTKIQKELGGKATPEQLAILQRYLDEWPDEWKGPYQELKERLVKLVRKLQTTEAVTSSSARADPFYVPRGGDAQVAFIGLTNSGRSSLVATLTHARLAVSDYPFTTQVPSPGMLHHRDAAIQLIDTPAIVPGLVDGAGPGQRLLQLIRAMDAIGVVVDLAQEPRAQFDLVRRELAAANVVLVPEPVGTVLAPKGKGGITFRGNALPKAERLVAEHMLSEHGIVHAEVIVRGQFAADELTAQLARQRVLPALIVGTKNDAPGAAAALVALRDHVPAYAVVDVNVLDEANVDQLKSGLVAVLGLMVVGVLERPAPDAPRTMHVLPRASSIDDLLERLVPRRRSPSVLARVWGPSAKYPGQPVGREHLVEDGDLVYLPL